MTSPGSDHSTRALPLILGQLVNRLFVFGTLALTPNSFPLAVLTNSLQTPLPGTFFPLLTLSLLAPLEYKQGTWVLKTSLLVRLIRKYPIAAIYTLV